MMEYFHFSFCWYASPVCHGVVVEAGKQTNYILVPIFSEFGLPTLTIRFCSVSERDVHIP